MILILCVFVSLSMARNASAQCLISDSPLVFDQFVREICLLVKECKLDFNRGLLLDGCEALVCLLRH